MMMMMQRLGRALRRVVLLIAALLAGLYIAVVVHFYHIQHSLVYMPDTLLVSTPAEAGLAYEEVWLTTDDGEQLYCWFVPAEQAESPESLHGVVLFFHGQSENISRWIERAAVYQRMGLATLLVDYRGYGRSSGRPDEQGTYLDAEAAWRYLTEERGVAPNDIILSGFSLGGGVASYLAEQHTPRALLLESTYTSLPDVGADIYPWLPVHLILHTHYPTRKRLANIDAPVLVMHSPHDDYIPYHHGERLYAAAREPKVLLTVRGPHGTSFDDSVDLYEPALREFLERTR